MAQSHHCVKREMWLNATMTERKPQDQDKFIVRLPDGMREKIKDSADRNNRSMNAEVVHALQFYFDFDALNEQSLQDPVPSEDRQLVIRVDSPADLDRLVAEMTVTYQRLLRESLLNVVESQDQGLGEK